MGEAGGRAGKAQDRAGKGASPVLPAMGDRSSARISVAEMKSYYVYSEWCSWLLSVAEGESLGPIGHPGWGHSRRSWLWWPRRDAVAVPPGDGSTSLVVKGGCPRESRVIGSPGAQHGPGKGCDE